MQPSNNNKIASIKNVSKKFAQNLAVNDISFDLYSGEVLSILGPNGAGKTTLLNMMLGRLGLSQGEMKLLGYQPGDIRLKRQCGAMLQVTGLPEMSTIKEQIHLFQSYYPQPMDYPQVLKLAGLKSIQNCYCKNLSGGQKQRLLFALSICGNPKLLFLDEPSTGMDVSIRESLWQTINSLKNNGTSIVLTTHYLQEADFLSDRIIMLNHGKIVRQGTPEEIKNSFNNKKIKFISSIPINKFTSINSSQEIQKRGKYYEIQSRDSVDTMQKIFKITDDVSDLTITAAALEDAFLKLTKSSNQGE
jgi:ABC-2 type transport system ATP-binding protein